MKNEPGNSKNDEDLSAESNTSWCRNHRKVTDLNLQEFFAGMGTLGTKLPEVAGLFGNQLCGSLWSPDDLSPEELTDQVNAVLALLTEFAPRNQLEAMLGIQAIAIHNAAMECMRRAMVPDENHQLCDLYFKHAAKLCRIFVTQTEALTRNKPITGTTLPEYGHGNGIPWKWTKKASSATCDDC